MATIAANCRTLPALHGWSGESHDAATAAFDRSKRPAAAIADAAEAIAQALVVGSHAVGTARTQLLDKATAIEAGRLLVTDGWVVLLKPLAMTRAEAVELQKLQAAEQAEINRLLAAVDDADNATARDLSAAAQRFGFTPPGSGDWLSTLVTVGSTRPGDDVADPRLPMTMLAQKQAQAADAATTVAARTDDTERNGTKLAVITMQDGSRREIREWKDQVPEKGQMPLFFSGRSPTTGSSETTYDPDGNRVLTIGSSTSVEGTSRTIRKADGSGVVAYIGAQGQKSGWTFGTDGSYEKDLPTDAPFFTHPELTVTGGGISALQNFAESPKGVAALGEATASKVAVGAKYGGPALGIATTVYDMAVADNQYEACRAMYSGVGGTVGGTVSGMAGGAAGAIAGGVGAPIGAGLGTIAGTWIFGKLGDEIGQMVCAK
ncbi:hypothetical protein [Williamsia phyllosphaerae]|uniref:hypothetical protein n=1 Tax=Williamsia phyllosphaerae TaxID=885042 RepID=UPI00166BD8E1|nr:hypothetical protein [Williamsia phyllosphaerae]